MVEPLAVIVTVVEVCETAEVALLAGFDEVIDDWVVHERVAPEVGTVEAVDSHTRTVIEE